MEDDDVVYYMRSDCTFPWVCVKKHIFTNAVSTDAVILIIDIMIIIKLLTLLTAL